MPRLASPLFALALTLLLGGCEKKPDPLAAAQLFFQQVSAGQAKAAYESAAFGFQAQRNAASFEVAAREMGLVEAASIEWDQPKIEGRTAKIPVRIKTKEGKPLSLIVTLTRESNKWQVYSLRSPPSEATGISENRLSLVGKIQVGVSQEGGQPTLRMIDPKFKDTQSLPVPPEAELRQLVRGTLLRFNEALTTSSFDAFYDSVSQAWQTGKLSQGQGQLTKGQLQREFQPFIDKKIDISAIKSVEPIWSAPVAVGTDGLLVLSGYFPTDAYQVHFSLKYIYEPPAWKLFGIDVNLRK